MKSLNGDPDTFISKVSKKSKSKGGFIWKSLFKIILFVYFFHETSMWISLSTELTLIKVTLSRPTPYPFGLEGAESSNSLEKHKIEC